MKKKKLVALSLAGAMLALTLTGCGSNSADSAYASEAESGAAAEVNTDNVPAASEENSASGEDVSEESTGSNFDASREINVLSREDGSGTRGAFIELFGIEQKDESGEKVDYTTEMAAITNSTAVMMQSVAGDLYSIGYISLGSMNDTVKAVQIDGVEASVENIKNDTYKIARPFHIVTQSAISEAAQDFIDYVMSADGQAVIEDNGYISVSDAGAYSGSMESGKVVVSGSSSVSPVMEKLKEAYVALNPGVTIEIQQSDSSTGVSNAIDGTCDIGMASRDLKDSETEAGVSATAIAMDGIAVIVNNGNSTDSLSSEQVMNIFTGNAVVWNDVAAQ